jgi:hypothetical protein
MAGGGDAWWCPLAGERMSGWTGVGGCVREPCLATFVPLTPVVPARRCFDTASHLHRKA